MRIMSVTQLENIKRVQGTNGSLHLSRLPVILLDYRKQLAELEAKTGGTTSDRQARSSKMATLKESIAYLDKETGYKF